MITQTFESKRKPVVPAHPILGDKPWYTAQEYAAAAARKITPAEYVRRDNIVKGLSNKCPFQVGDTAYPYDKKGYEEYGQCIVLGVCRSYKDFSADEPWPKNDNPFIVSFASCNDRKSVTLCTSNYLLKKNPHLEVC